MLAASTMLWPAALQTKSTKSLAVLLASDSVGLQYAGNGTFFVRSHVSPAAGFKVQ